MLMCGAIGQPIQMHGLVRGACNCLDFGAKSPCPAPLLLEQWPFCWVCILYPTQCEGFPPVIKIAKKIYIAERRSTTSCERPHLKGTDVGLPMGNDPVTKEKSMKAHSEILIWDMPLPYCHSILFILLISPSNYHLEGHRRDRTAKHKNP